MKNEPLVTVIIPHHGDTQFLGDALNSVIAQDYGNIQILLVLDRPSTEVTDFIKNFKDLRRVQVLLSNAPGLVATLNYGFGFVDSGLVARLDSDDIMAPNRISMQVEYFSKHKDLGALGCQLIEIDGTGREIRAIKYPISNFELKLRVKLSSPIAHTALMLRSEAFKKAGGYLFEDFPAEDFGLLKRIGNDWLIANSSEILGKYRIHNTSISSLNKYAQVAKSLEIALGAQKSRLISKSASIIVKNEGHFGLKSLCLLALHSPLNTLMFVIHLCIARLKY